MKFLTDIGIEGGRMMKKILCKEDLQFIAESYQRKNEKYKYTVYVCFGAGCISSNCKAVRDAVVKSLAHHKLKTLVKVVETGCIGACAWGPSILIQPGEVYYIKVDPTEVDEIVREHLGNGRIVYKKCFYDEEEGRYVEKLSEINYFKKQQRIVLENCGHLDYASMDDYISKGGYQGLLKALTEYTDHQLIEEIKKSGLRGRGGGGFPTGLKWEFAWKNKNAQKYVICNADEGDPGEFMDRSVLEGDPHSVIEGMALCGYAIGASKGFVYVRAEYPLAVERLQLAIEKARERGLLGKNLWKKNLISIIDPNWSRSFRLRRRDGSHSLHRRKTGRAKAKTTFSG